MNLTEARHQLKLARKKFRNTKKEIADLMAFITKKGGDPSGRPDTSKRDLRMYKLRQKGVKTREIALQFKLSTDRVRAICNAFKKPRKKAAKKKPR